MTEDTLIHIMALTLAYMLGSLPFGLWISWIFDLEDPRTKGSLNIGATNILRSGHKGAALLTLLLDISKGSAAVLFANMIDPHITQLAGVFAVAGHVWPIWLAFKGGKGVATAFGVFLVLSWSLALICFVTWVVIAMTTRYSSLASLTAILLSPLYTAIISGEGLILTCLALAIMMIWAHRTNIGRLLTGRESQIGHRSP